MKPNLNKGAFTKPTLSSALGLLDYKLISAGYLNWCLRSSAIEVAHPPTSAALH
jgi:hypothetical protein